MKPISFIIISYNRVDDTLALLQNISKLSKAADLLEEVIVVNNASTVDYSKVKEFADNSKTISFKYYDAPSNLGVTKGRNYALQFAQGEILIFLDDDALLQNEDALENVLKAFEGKGLDNREIAIVSFKVLYYENLEMQVNALPHKNFREYKNKPTFYTYYFAGGAHAIKRKILNQTGNLPDAFFYGMEEYDLSYRIIQFGYCIKYDASIIMLHKESPLGRKPKKEKLQMMWVNKSIVAYRYLPIGYFYTTAIMWSLQYLRETNFNIKGFFIGWKNVLKIFKQEKRTPLNHQALTYLNKTQARLWY
ncbi:MAG: glycosyltransferase family 2 protein [Chitinophagaceae bacterium]|nr:glycosyltransferase family 2 protein [Chitinophagaceae bacterium]